MLLIELHKNASIFFDDIEPVELTFQNVAGDRELDDLIENIVNEHPETGHIKIFSVEGLCKIEHAVFSCINHMHIYTTEGANLRARRAGT